MKSFTGLLLASFLFFGIFSGCSKNDGASGPTGQAGATGATGAPGNANVKSYKDSITSSSGWTYNGSLWYAFFPNINITKSFLSSGGFVEAFISTDDETTWTILPAPYQGSGPTAQWTYSYTSLSSGTGVYIYFQWSDLQQHTDPYITYGSKAYFNIVCIAADVVNKYPQTNWGNYQALMRIPELNQNKAISQ